MLIDNFSLTGGFVSRDNVEGAQKFVVHTIERLRDHIVANGGTARPKTNPICIAADAIFETALSADASEGAEIERMEAITARFRSAATYSR